MPMNKPDSIREQTLRACIDACRHAARLAAAAANDEGPHSALLMQGAERCEAIAARLSEGRAPSAIEFMQAADLCSRCAQACEQFAELSACADACRRAAQLCLTLAQSGSRKASAHGNGAAQTGPRPQRGALSQQLRPDAALAAIVGSDPLTRADVTRKVWAYLKAHELQDPHDRRRIHADERLKPVFDGSSRISMFEMSRCLNRHLT